MKIYLKGVAVSFALIAIVSGLIYSLDQQGFFSLQNLELHVEVPKSFLDSLAFESWQLDLKKDMQALYGISLLQLGLEDLNEVVKLHKWVQKIEIQRNFPNELQIKVKPFHWKALYLKNNKLFPLTTNNSFLPAVSLTKAPTLPIIQINDFESKKKLRLDLIKILKNLPESGSLSLNAISEITDNGEGILLKLAEDGSYVRLGNEQLELRIARVEKVLEYLKEKKLKSRVISADFSQKVVVKLRKRR